MRYFENIVIAGSSDQTVSFHFCEPQLVNIICFFPPSIIQYSSPKSQSTAPIPIWKIAGTNRKIIPEFYTFLCYPIGLYDILISQSPHHLSSRHARYNISEWRSGIDV
jgi:hypothetical protein